MLQKSLISIFKMDEIGVYIRDKHHIVFVNQE